MEVPEIYDGTVQIRAAAQAREKAVARTKIEGGEPTRMWTRWAHVG